MANVYYYNESGAATYGHATGRVFCDGSTDVWIECGFKPSRFYFFLRNSVAEPTGNGYNDEYIWQTPMDSQETGAYHIIRILPNFSTTANNPQNTQNTNFKGPIDGVNGVHSADKGEGFFVSATVLTSGDHMYWVAWR